jgi:succinate-semialdehyde dehydrogenase/glutarate-semialdehyde dehydrogenase
MAAALKAACEYASIRDASLLRSELFVGGKWRSLAAGGGTFAVTNPATGIEILKLPRAGAAEAAECVEAAAKALPAWSSQTAQSRADVLRTFSSLMHANAEDLARIMVLEQGKPMAEAKGEVRMPSFLSTKIRK